ncbi:hypothetical protein JXD20_02965 [Candidatus Peregrinibacteria bacterium]|nr:hypothetical protein [Candidatus Peregrinibacteria bacterium]
MLIKKENYREFDGNRFIFAGFEKPDAAEAAKKKPEEKKGPKEGGVEDKNAVIKQYREDTVDYIGATMAAVRTEYKEAYRKIAEKLTAHAHDRFDTISRQYNGQLATIGPRDFEGSEAAQQYEKQAKKVFTDITEKLDKGRIEYSKHQYRQDRMDTAREDMKKAKTPKEKEAARADLRKVQEDIIVDYLSQSEDTKGMSPAMRKNLARFIVRAGLVKLDYADIDAKHYNNNVNTFFKHVEGFQAHIETTLKGKVGKVVDMFLATLPNPEATPKETELFKTWIKEAGLEGEGGMGDLDKKGTLGYNAAIVLAKRFHVHFEGKEVICATDLLAKPQLVVDGADAFKAKVMVELRDILTSSEQLAKYSEQVETGTEWLRDKRDEIKKGLTWVFQGGKVTEWGDWPGHEAADDLMLIGDRVQGHVDKHREKLTEKKREAETADRQKEARDEYWNYITSSGLDTAVNKALTQDGYTSVYENVKPKGDPPYSGEQVLKGKEGQEIKINVASDGVITVTVSSGDAKGMSYSVEHRYSSPQKFKAAKVDLHKLAVETHDNLKKSQDQINYVSKALEAARTAKGGPEIEFNFEPNFSKFIAEGSHIPDPVLKVDGYQVGSLAFGPMPAEGKEGTVVIRIRGQKDSAPIKVSELGKALPKQMKALKEVAEKAKKNEEAVNKQVEADMKGFKVPKSLAFTKVDKLTGDFANAKDKIKIGDLATVKGKDHVATLSVMVGTEGDKPRKYVLTVNGEDLTFDSMKKVNEHLAKHAEVMAEAVKKMKPQELKGNPEAIKLRERVREKMIAYMKKYLPHLKPPFSMDRATDQDFINRCMNKISIPILQKIDKSKENSPITLTPDEQNQVIKAFNDTMLEMTGASEINEVDPKEVEAINSLKIKIGDGPEKPFNEVFGDDLVQILSRTHEIKPGKEPNTLLIKQGEEFVQVDAKGLVEFLPPLMRQDYIKILNGDKVDMKVFREKGEMLRKGLSDYGDLMKVMESPEAKKTFEKMTTTEMLASLAKLWQLLQKALQSGDWQSLQDALDDFQKGINPTEHMEHSRKVYETKINGTGKSKGVEDTGRLIELYNDPYGPAAQELFKGEEQLAYRIQLKEVIEERFARDLEVTISEMKKISPHHTQITCSRGADRFVIHLERRDGKTYARKEQIKTKEDGTDYNETVMSDQEVRNTDSGDKSLAFILFKKKPATSNEGPGKPEKKEETETKKKAPQGIKEGFATINKEGQTVLTEKAAQPKIGEILEENVAEITITVSSDRIGSVKKGETVTVKRENGFAVTSGERLRIAEGDIVVSTKLQQEKPQKEA